jgi:hypothetical protein
MIGNNFDKKNVLCWTGELMKGFNGREAKRMAISSNAFQTPSKHCRLSAENNAKKSIFCHSY